MAGLAVIDVPTGRLVAAASANSPCYSHDKTRLGPLPADCPNLPEDTVHKPRVPQTLTNHALFTQAPPGSLVKPLLMSGIVMHESAQASLVGLDQAMQRSDSQQFLDAFLCRQKLGQGSFSASCDRPALTLKSAHRLGWNSGCDGLTDAARAQCGMVDLMHGLPLAQRPPQLQGVDVLNWRASDLPVLMGQTLVQPFRSASGVSGYQDMTWPESLPSSEQRKTCAASGTKGYVRCTGPQMAIISEGYGQGNTLATPTGVASLMATLANSSHGQASHHPHVLVDRVGTDGQTDAQLQRLQRAALTIGPEGIEPTVARRVLAAMEKTHMPGGTAYSACVRAFGAEACSASRGVAGKTGTPGDADERSLSQLAQDMRARAQCRNTTAKNCAQQFPLPRPRYRWYAAVFKSQGSERYDKAIAVLVHSNWRKSDGRYADDQNAAAEMGMLAIKQFQTAPVKP
jgi:cell division protein FtsI/penicillin-binding protein 2